MTKEDIEKLDFILNKLIENEGTVGSNDLHIAGYYEHYNDSDNKIENDFKFLKLVYEDLKIGRLSSTKDGNLISYNSNVLRFKSEYDSFKNYYSMLKEQTANEELENEKENERQELRDKIHVLKIDELEYKITIRQLEEELKVSSLLKNYWWLIASAITVALAVGKFVI